ncbi:MAG: HAD-IIIA family hydrolase [Undibacterium sp.]|nr:HAD-IIIA family hydrolase [Opitutaceae bacterium]
MSVKKPISPALWSRIRLFAMDVDGVLTDGTVLISSDGTESKRFSILDGLGLARLRDVGLPLAWISGRASGATTARATELKIPHLIQGRVDKLTALTELAAQLGLPLSACAYMGDDVIDVPALRAAGLGISVPGAMPEALAAADYITKRTAGLGAVREVCDLLLAARRNVPSAAPTKKIPK